MGSIADKLKKEAYEKGFAAAELQIAGFLRARASEQGTRPRGVKPSTARSLIAQALQAAADDIEQGDYLEVPWRDH